MSLCTLQTLALTFPLTPRWTGLATTVYLLTWVAALTAAWNLSAYLLGLLFFNPAKPAFHLARQQIWNLSVFDRSLTFWGLILPLGIAGTLSQLAIEPGLWQGTFEPLDAAMPTLRAFVLLTALTILASVWAFTQKPSSPSGDTGREGSDAALAAVLALLTALFSLDKITGLGISSLDLSTGGVNEALMWLFLSICVTAAGLSPLVSHPAHGARLARIGLGAGGLTLFFATVTATIRTGEGVSPSMMLAFTGLVVLGASFLLLLTMAHLSKPGKAAGLFRFAGFGAATLAAGIVAVSFFSRTEADTTRIAGKGQVTPSAPDPLLIAPTVAQDYDARELDLGKNVFIRNCATCHGIDIRIVGPPVTEISSLYRHDPLKLASWVKNPGRRRQDYPQMAAIMLTEDRYQAVAKFMIALGQTQLEKEAALSNQ